MEALGGAGAWVATPADLVRLVDSLDTTRPGWHPLSAELAALMPIPMAGVSFPDPGQRLYGLGTIVWPDGSWGHTGTVEATHAMVAHRPDGVTWSILVSGETPAETESLRDVFADALAGAGITLTAPLT
jgi:D-alanyl-D-alanine carboxypeptidase